MIINSTQRQVVLFFECPVDQIVHTVNEFSDGNEIVSVSHAQLDPARSRVVSVLMVVRGRIEEMAHYEARMTERLGIEVGS